MYGELLKKFENVENLGGKAWQHSLNIDLIEQTNIKDCSIHCFHYQQMFEMLFKHLLGTKSKYGSYSHSHKLHRLLEELIEYTSFITNKTKYKMALQVITVCAEEYRYNFLIDCEDYKESVKIANELLKELLAYDDEKAPPSVT
ncbi:MAG: HEPN domain-containing protein [Thiomargarita sp.]|nr:HEPN domain-containing protein [Thiomargarita sp.]